MKQRKKATLCNETEQGEEGIPSPIQHVDLDFDLNSRENGSDYENYVENSLSTFFLQEIGLDTDTLEKAGRKRGRPPKDPGSLHPKTARKKFNAEVNDIKQKIEILNHKSAQYGWDLTLEVAGKVKSNTAKKFFDFTTEESEDKLNILVRKIAYLKIKWVCFCLFKPFQLTVLRHLISDAALSVLLGSKLGINYRIKAHYIFNFISKLKSKMLEEIPIETGEMGDGRKWARVQLVPLVTWILRQQKYSQILHDAHQVANPFL